MQNSRLEQENIGDISNLNQNLTEQYLGYNQLTSLILPENPVDMSNLIELSLNHNQLTSIPESIGNLSNLTHL